MKTPKIGDIVLCWQKSYMQLEPAIVLHVYESGGAIRLYSLTPSMTVADYFYSPYPQPGYWSWPEEEKQQEKSKECKHESYIEYVPPANNKRYAHMKQYKCMECGIEFDREKPKECEHQFNGMTTFGWEKCSKCGDVKELKSPAKAEELIDKIYKKIMFDAKDWQNPINPTSYFYVSYIAEICLLIKEYKGIK